MTRKPVSTEDGRILYLDSDGKFYEKPIDEPVDPDAKRVCTALSEHPGSHNPNREPGDPWSIEDSKWPWLWEVRT